MTLNTFRQINQWFSLSLSHISDSLWNIFDWIFQSSFKFNRLDLSNPFSHFLYRWYHFLEKKNLSVNSSPQVYSWSLPLVLHYVPLSVLHSLIPCLHPQGDHKPAARSFPGLYFSEVHQSLSLSSASSFPPTKTKFLLVLWYIPHNPYLYLFNPLLLYLCYFTFVITLPIFTFVKYDS